MKKVRFYALYFAAPALAIALYAARLGLGPDAYGLSVALGLFAFTAICWQFALAARPRWAVEALGQRGLLSFHATMAFAALLAAALHRSLKVGLLEGPPAGAAAGGATAGFLDSVGYALRNGLGFKADSAQASLGGLAFWVFAALALFAVLFMANSFWMRIAALKALREWVYGKTGLSYKLARAFHNAVAAAAAIVLCHVLLASSTSFASNPAGAALLLAYLAAGAATYLRYRLRGRSAAGAAAPARGAGQR